MALESLEPQISSTPSETPTDTPAPLPSWLDPKIPTDQVPLIVVPVKIDPSDPDTVPTTPDNGN